MMAPSTAVVAYYRLPDLVRPSGWRRVAVALAVAGLHLAGLLLAFGMVSRPVATQPLAALEVRVIDAVPPSPPRALASSVSPAPKPRLAPPPSARTPPPVTRAAPAQAAMPVAQPSPARGTDERPMPPAEAPSATVADTAPAPAPVAAASWQPARFDAAYLHNPRPAYPETARRLGQQGKVVLRVRVSTQGTPLAIEVRQSSGFSRLDEAARSAVERWRFVPARRGDEAVESSVLVPFQFDLRTDGEL